MTYSTHKKYLTINSTDQKWGLAINSVGHQSIAENEVYPPQIHPTRYLFNTQTGRTLDEYQLLYITSGKGMFYSESGGRHQVREGDMFLLFPGDWHTYRPEQTTGWNEYWIGFNGRIMEDWVKEGFFPRSLADNQSCQSSERNAEAGMPKLLKSVASDQFLMP